MSLYKCKVKDRRGGFSPLPAQINGVAAVYPRQQQGTWSLEEGTSRLAENCEPRIGSILPIREPLYWQPVSCWKRPVYRKTEDRWKTFGVNPGFFLNYRAAHPAASNRHSLPKAHETFDRDPEPLTNRYECHLRQRNPQPGESKYTSHVQCPGRSTGWEYPPLKHTRIEGEEGVKWVCAGLHRVPASCVSNDRQHLAIIPLDDGVAEDQLVFAAERQSQDTDGRL